MKVLRERLDYAALGILDVLSPEEVTNGDICVICGKGEATGRAHEVLDVRGELVLLSEGKRFDFTDPRRSRLLLLWKDPGDYGTMFREMKNLLDRISLLRQSPRFDGSWAGSAYIQLLRLAEAVDPTDVESHDAQTTRLVKVLWGWVKENRKRFLWRHGDPTPTVLGGRWDRLGLTIGLRPAILQMIATSANMGSAHVRFLLKRAGVLLGSQKRGPGGEVLNELSYPALHALCVSAGVPESELDEAAGA